MALLDNTPLAGPANALTSGLGGLGVLGNPQRLQTPAQISRAQQMAAALQKEGSDYSPIASPWQGAARIADVLVGDRQASQAADADIARQNYIAKMFSGALGGGQGPATQNPYAAALSGNSSPAPSTQQTGSLSDGTGGFDVGGLIDQSALQHGIDPSVARRVFQSEGGAGYVGDNGSSFGPFQLHYGGVAGGGNAVPGMGDDFTKATGLDARDPSTVPQQVDFAMAQAAKGGWGPWHGAQAAGIGNMDGIGVSTPQAPSAGPLQPIPVGPASGMGPGGAIPPVAPASAQAYAPQSPATDPTSGAVGAIAASAGPPGGDSASTSAGPQLAMSGAPPAGQAQLPNGAYGGAQVSAPTPRAAGVNAGALLSIMTSPYATPEQQQQAASLYSALAAPKPMVSAGDGYLFDPNRGTFVASPGAGHPSTITELKDGSKVAVDTYNPRRPAVPIGPQGNGAITHVMSADELKAANLPPDAHTQVNTKTGEISAIPGAAGDDSYMKPLTEGLGKAHAALANGVEEAQTRGRDLNAMQGAIQRIQANGGTTGGLAQEDILNLKKAINSGANVLGIKEPFNDLSDPEFLTKFNRQIAAAAASSNSGGGRVTNFALQNMLKANPGMELTLEGNQRLIGIQQQIEQRNVAVGQHIRDMTGQAMAAGQKVQPNDVEKSIRDYDNANHIMDPITGQDLTKNPTLADLKGASGPNKPGPQNPGSNVAPQQTGAPAAPKSRADYDALPHGATYTAPDGQIRRKP